MPRDGAVWGLRTRGFPSPPGVYNFFPGRKNILWIMNDRLSVMALILTTKGEHNSPGSHQD